MRIHKFSEPSWFSLDTLRIRSDQCALKARHSKPQRTLLTIQFLIPFLFCFVKTEIAERAKYFFSVRCKSQLWARGAGTALRTWRRAQKPDPDFRIPHQCNSAASNKNRAQNSHIVDKNSVVQRLVGTVSFGIGAYPLNILLAHLHQLGHVRMDCVSGLWRWNAKVSDTFPKYVWVTSTQ